MSQREEKISKLLEFPYDAFLMIRLEYVQILDDELEAKLLRIIEKNVEQERKNLYQKMLNAAGTPPNEKVDITRDIWVPISYRLFMNDLFGTVTSENTVKKALKRMIDKKIIFHRFEPKKKYDAPEYKIHVNVLQMLLTVLKNPGYQSLIPSIVDTLKKLPPQELTPSECQKLIPSMQDASTNPDLRVSEIGTSITEDYGNNITSITEGKRDFTTVQSPRALSETENENYSYRHDHTRKEDAWACNNWRGAHKGKTCADYQVYIDSGQREEAPTEPRIESVKIGATDGNVTTRDHSGTGISDRSPDRGSLLKVQSPAGNPNGTTHTQQPTQVAIASTSGGTAFPPAAAVRQSQTTPVQGSDGAATERSSGPRASGKRKGKKVTQAEPEPIPEEAVRIMDDWDILMKRACPRTEGDKGTIAAAKALIPSHPTRDDLKAVWQFCFKSNPDWYRAHGVSIQDIEKNFGKWQSLHVPADPPPEKRKPAEPYVPLPVMEPDRSKSNGRRYHVHD